MSIKLFPSKTIAVTLQGGLGNQMFQYAIARCFAYRNNYKLWIDISKYTKNNTKVPCSNRYFNLGKFNISGQITNRNNINYLFAKSSKNKLLKHLINYRLFKNWEAISEDRNMYWKYDENIFNLNIKDNIWLVDGYWQNPKYFSPITQLIRKEFTLRDSISKKNIDFAAQIVASNSVSIHIRRGDMALIRTINEKFGLLDLDYYFEAVKIMASHILKPLFFIFSDDPEWVEENFVIPFPFNTVKHNTVAQDYLDLYLMSLCKNHIIANSTFSWWGAWLGTKINQRVIAPNKPFRTFDIPVQEYYPAEWILI